jgi:DNA replication protein DnaC
VLRRVEPQETEACPFGECDGSTWLLDEETNETRPCRCREQRMRKAVSGGIGTGIGRRFLEVSFDREPIVSLDPVVLRAVRAFIRSVDDNLDAGRGLWFDGPVGTGKTSLAILVAKAAKDAGRSYAVYPVPRLLAEIKRTFDRDASDTYLGFFRRLCTVDVLVLDDLGAEKQTEWVLEQLYSIVN